MLSQSVERQENLVTESPREGEMEGEEDVDSSGGIVTQRRRSCVRPGGWGKRRASGDTVRRNRTDA